MKYLSLLLLSAALLPLSLTEAQADTLLIEKIETAQAVDRPSRGQNMERVRSAFGEPASVKAAVGDPPITRWVYEDFTVYFEHQLVITSVVKR